VARCGRKILKILGWIVAGVLSLILLVTLAFYLGRGLIMQRTLTYLNENRPGEIRMEQMNLIPFMNFPDVLLQLRNVSFYEKEVLPDSLYQEPILWLNEVYISLDIVDLIKGTVDVSEVRLLNGFVRLEIYEDSVSNLENALGIRFGEGTREDTVGPARRINLEKIELTDILALFHDRTRDNRVNLKVNQLSSSFSYLPGLIEADIELNVDINEIKYLTYSIEKKEAVQFESRVSIDTERKHVEIDPSSLQIAGLELETWGSYSYSEEPNVNLAFRATNTGLDVLNFLFMGVLDLDEIEQIGAGSIHLDGNITGSLKNQLPVVRVNGSARQIGFRIKSVERDVTGISFDMFATNGSKKDLSEGWLEVKDFSASFPEGNLRCNLRAKNLVTPEIDLEMNGDVEITGLEQMIKVDKLSALEGYVSLAGKLKGVLDRGSDRFLNESGTLDVIARDVGFVLDKDTISGISGAIYMEDSIIGARDLGVIFNGNRLKVEVKVENILYYLLGYKRDVKAQVSLASEVIYPERIMHDTMVAGFLGEELRGVHLRAGASIKHQELDLFLKKDSFPAFQFTLDSFGVALPLFADISDMKAAVNLGHDTLYLPYLDGMIGSSGLHLSGEVANYASLLRRDSGAVVSLEYSLASDVMRAEDFLSYGGRFMLPEVYRTEYLENLHLAGSLMLPVAGLLSDTIDLDFGLTIRDLRWNFRYYPLAFNHFNIQLRKEGDQLIINELSGEIGDNNLKLNAMVGNFTDSLRHNIYGSMVLESDLLDLNELLDYQLPEELKDTVMRVSSGTKEPNRLDQIDYPDFSLNVNIGELRYGDSRIHGMQGELRSSSDKILSMDHLVIVDEHGGTMQFTGQLNVANPGFYNLSTEIDLKDIHVKDLDFEMQIGEEIYTLKENFAGLVKATGLAEVYITPDYKLDMAATTAMFNVEVTDGELNNFKPLEAAGKYLNNKDLYHVRFSTLRNSFTLIDSKIIIPLMIIESSIGQLLIEGEQGLDKSYLYLMYVPTWLVKDAAKSRLTNAGDDQQEDQIRKMKMGKFLMLTLWSDGKISEVKLGDKRENYR
jgi:hypothetical protein